jgi:hypothetical protein
MARDQHERSCDMFVRETPRSEDGEAAMSAGILPEDHPRSSVEEVALDLEGTINDAPLFGSSGGCPSDVSVPLGASTFVLPFSALCSQLQVLGYAVMALAYLAAAFIVFGGGRR